MERESEKDWLLAIGEDIQCLSEERKMENRLWAYTNDLGWFAVDPSTCDYDEEQVDSVEAVLEANTKHELMAKAEIEGYEIAMWLE